MQQYCVFSNVTCSLIEGNSTLSLRLPQMLNPFFAEDQD